MKDTFHNDCWSDTRTSVELWANGKQRRLGAWANKTGYHIAAHVWRLSYGASQLLYDTECSDREIPTFRNNMLPSASLFYSEGKGSGFLQNTDAIIIGATPPPHQKKLLVHCPGKQKRTPLHFVHIRYVADYRQINKRNLPLQNYFT